MTPRKNPPRPWDIDDLLDIGKRSEVTYLKAVPVLILEKWVRGEREEGVANYVRTNSLARRLVDCNLVDPFKPRGTSNIVGALCKIQNGRNLTRPLLIEPQGRGISWVNLPHYEPLLQEYRQTYRERHPQDYAKLFPEGEPEWESPSRSKAQPERKGTEPTPELEAQDEVDDLLARLEQAMREQKQAMESLEKENKALQEELATLQASGRRIADGELRSDCGELLENEKYHINAIRSAGVVLEERLRKAIGGTGAEASKYGVGLVDYALRKDTGQLVISEHSAEQEGVHMLFRGAVQFVRNPPMHKKLRYTEVEARGAVGLIDYLLLLLQRARPRE